MRLARLGHPYPGLEAFAAGVVGSGLRCEEGLVAGCSRQCRRCASEGVGRPNSGHGVRSMLLSRNCTVEPQWAMVRAKWAALRAAFESNGADRFDRVRTPPVETTHRRGGPGRATSAGGRGRGSAGMGTRTMREKVPNAGERAVHWACEVAIRCRGEGEPGGRIEGSHARRQQCGMWSANGRGTSSGAAVGNGGGEGNAGLLRDWRDRGNGCGADAVGVNCATTGWPRPGMGMLEHGAGAGGAALGGGHRPGRLATVNSRRAMQGPQREYSPGGGS